MVGFADRVTQMLPYAFEGFGLLMERGCIDVSDDSKVASAAAELLKAAASPEMEGKPIEVVLTKLDAPLTLSRAEVETVVPLGGFRAFTCSAYTGEGVEAIAEARGGG